MKTKSQKKKATVIWIVITVLAVISMVAYLIAPIFYYL